MYCKCISVTFKFSTICRAETVHHLELQRMCGCASSALLPPIIILIWTSATSFYCYWWFSQPTVRVLNMVNLLILFIPLLLLSAQTVALTLLGVVLAPVLPQGKMSVLSQNMVLLQKGVFNVVIVNCQLANKVKVIINFVLNFEVKSFKFLTSTLIHGGEKLGWTIRLLLESLQHVLKIYTWSMSENQASVQFRCKLIGLLLRQSLFRKHYFALLVHRIYHDYQNLHFWHLKTFSKLRVLKC